MGRKKESQKRKGKKKRKDINTDLNIKGAW